MSVPAVRIEGDLAAIEFDRFDLDAYRVFLRAKALPESRVAFDWRADRYTLTTPARFAPRLGAALPEAQATQQMPLADHLFDYQRWAVGMALDAKRYALWADTGLGKGPMALEWARQVQALTGARVLYLMPLAVIPQIRAEAARFYGDALPTLAIATRDDLIDWCRRGDPGTLAFCNYEKFIPGQIPELRLLGGLVADECFAAGTMVDTALGQKRIENCIIGEQIRNAAGIDTVSDVHRREVPYAIRLTVAGQPIISSPNHPYLTQRGWMGARDIIPGDGILATTEAVRMVQDALHGPVPLMGEEAVLFADVCGQGANGQTGRQGADIGSRQATATGAALPALRGAVSPDVQAADEAVLLAILLSEMADVPTGASGQSPHPGSCQEARPEEAGLVRVGVTGSRSGAGTHPRVEPDEQPRNAGQSLPPIESHGPRTFRAWGEWSGADRAAADHAGCTWADVGSGVSLVTGPIDSRLSVELQARLSRSRAANQYRGGWTLPLQPQGGGPEAGRDAPFARVDRLEVLEPGHPDLEALRDADGKLYFYDLGGTRHPSFSINGLLVHNSSLLKTGGGVIKWNLIKSARGVEYKLSCTATPAPNDAMEYASQAAFLEKLRTEGEILWTYFHKGDKGQWTIKPHAKAAFYAFMASWSLYVRDPAAFGFADILASLPDPIIAEERIPLTDEQRREMTAILATHNAGMFGDALGVTARTKLAQIARGFLYEGRNGSKATRLIHSAKPQAVADRALDEMQQGRPTLIWTTFDAEGEIVRAAMRPGGFDVAILSGATPEAERLPILDRFRAGAVQALISKPQLIGYGLNLQFVKSMVFSGFDDSFERTYQAIRRAYRFGQTDAVRVFFPYVPELEGLIFENIRAKEARFLAEVAAQEALYREALGMEASNAA